MNKKYTLKQLKYAVLNKETNKLTIFRYKNKVADYINVSTRTLDRSMPYENRQFLVVKVSNVV